MLWKYTGTKESKSTSFRGLPTVSGEKNGAADANGGECQSSEPPMEKPGKEAGESARAAGEFELGFSPGIMAAGMSAGLPRANSSAFCMTPTNSPPERT